MIFQFKEEKVLSFSYLAMESCHQICAYHDQNSMVM